MNEFRELVTLCFGDVSRAFFAEKWTGVKKIPSPEGRERIRGVLEEYIRNPSFQFRRSRIFRRSER
jgi:hypothetical protein